MASEKINLDILTMQDLYGIGDSNLKELEGELSVTFVTRDGNIEVNGASEEQVKLAIETLHTLEKMRQQGEIMNGFAVTRALSFVRSGDAEAAVAAMKDVIAYTHSGAPVKCRTIGQKQYVQAMKDNTVTICIGPAGTGKTYLAVAAAVAALKNKQVDKIIMCRPAVEAGEKLGFLPGDLQNKVDPFLRPLYDALDDLLGAETVTRYMENRTIEIAPLAYMRGRTLKRAAVLVDECQNMALNSHLMILTRLGEGSRMVLTGDVTQVDLPSAVDSGLETCAGLLSGIDDIAVIRLHNVDVVRHKLVGKIVKAFEAYTAASSKPSGKKGEAPKTQQPQRLKGKFRKK